MPLVLDGTNGVSGVDGTASNPAIEGTDSNTGIFYPAADTVAIGTGGTERLRVDSAGNAGLATTSINTTVWGSTYPKLAIGTTTNAGVLQFESTAAAANNKYLGGVSALNLGSGVTANESADILFYQDGTSATNPGGRISFFTRTDASSVTEKMRLDASGNLGIGTTSPNTKLHLAAAGDVGGKAVNSATTGSATFNVTNNSGSIGQLMIYGSAQGAYGALGSGEVAMYCTTSTTLMVDNVSGVLKFTAGGNTERARITSGGNLLVNGTTEYARISSTDASWCYQANNTSNGNLIRFSYNGTTVGSISTNGTTTTYSTTSDYRLKENVQPMIGALAKVAALKPCTYTWKSTGKESHGFIAHELQVVVPECVTGEKDAVEIYTDEEGNEQTRPVYQGIDTSFLVATLTAAIQELNAKVEAQAAEIAALKAQP